MRPFAKHVIAAASAFALCLTSFATPALAIAVSETPREESQAISPRLFLQLETTLTAKSGIKINVGYTYNDAYGLISGVRWANVVSAPGNTCLWTVTYSINDGGKNVCFKIHYFNSSTQSWGDEYVYLYA